MRRLLLTLSFLVAAGAVQAGTANATTFLAPVPCPVGPQDSFEINDTRTQASGPLAAETSYCAALDTDNDADWFAFYTLDRQQVTITIAATGDSGRCRVHAALDGADVIDPGYIYVNDGDQETISLTLPAATAHTLLIDDRNCSERTPYTISISTTGTLTDAPCTTALDLLARSRREFARANAALKEARGKARKARARKNLRTAKRHIKNAQERVAGACAN